MGAAQTIAEMKVVYTADGVQLKEVTREVGKELTDTEKAITAHENMVMRLAGAIDPLVGQYGRLAKQINAINALESKSGVTEQTAAWRSALDAKTEKLSQQKTLQQQVAEEARRMAESEAAATKRFLESVDPTLRAFNDLDEKVAELHRRFESGLIPQAQFEKLKAQFDEEREALYALSDAGEVAGHKLASGFSAHELAAKKAGISVGQYTMALRTLPMQMTDIVTQLAGGQNPLLILIQQGGQVRDSFGGIRPALAAVTGMLNPATLGMAALAAATLAIPASMHDAGTTFDEISNSLAMTGGAAFDSADKLATAAERIGNETGNSFASTAKVMSELVAQGKFTGAQIEAITRTTQDWSRATGESADKIEQAFGEIADNPVQAIKKLNNQYDFLTAAQAKHIVMLDKAGHHTEAMTELTNLFAGTMDKRSRDIISNASQLEQCWDALKKWARNTTTAVGIDFNAMASMLIDTVDVTVDKIQALLAHSDAFIYQSVAGVGEAASKIPGLHDVFAPAAEEARKAADAQKKIWDDAEKDAGERLNRMKSGLQGYRDSIWEGENPQKGPGEKDAVADVVDDSKKHPKAYHDDEGTKRLATLKEQTAVLQEQTETSLKQTDSEKKLAAFEQEIAGLSGKKLTLQQQSLIVHRSEIEAQLQKNIGLEKEINHQQILKKMLEEQRDIQLTTDKMRGQGIMDAAAVTMSSRGAGQMRAENQIHEEFAARRAQLDKEVADKASEEYRRQTDFLRDEENKRIALSRDSAQQRAAAEQDFLGGAMAGMQDWASNQMDLADRVRQATTGLFDNMSQSVMNFALTGKLNFRNFTVEILKDISRIAMQIAISKAVEAIVGSFGGSPGGGAGGSTGGSGTAIANAGANFQFNALGGIYNSPSLSAFSGQIVNRPTPFAFAHGAGLMGEAGPEGIFPLRRGADGKLGVVAAMAGGGAPAFAPQYNINIQNDGQNGQIGPQALQAVYDVGKKAAADYAREQQRDGGSMRRF